METIPRIYFQHKTGKDLDKFIDLIFNFYRKNGFPHYPTNRYWRDSEFVTLMKAPLDTAYHSGILKMSNTSGVSLANSYFPHRFDVMCGGKKTPMQAFNDDVHFRKVLYRVVKYSKVYPAMSDECVRKALTISGTQTASNFRPIAAATLYELYGGRGGVVWDMSGGWGGRLLGAVKAGVKHYIATDPSTLTAKCLNQLGDDYMKKHFEIAVKGSEVFRPTKNSIDMCFTSPPYFNVEKYSDEPTQSFKKFDSRELWLNGFMLKTLENCYYGLKNGKYCLINIADPRHEKGLSIVREMPKLGKQAGFKFVGLLNLELKALPNLLGSPLVSERFKTEPIFVFKK